jgi:hypothetical protein
MPPTNVLNLYREQEYDLLFPYYKQSLRLTVDGETVFVLDILTTDNPFYGATRSRFYIVWLTPLV